MEKDSRNKENEYRDRFSQLMFGPFPSSQMPTPEHHGTGERENSPPLAREFDFAQFVENVDTLVSSLQKLKPLVRKITPLMDLFKK